MKRPSSPPSAEMPAGSPAPGLSTRWQIAISLLLLVHLCALLTAPLQVAAAGSPAIRPLSLLQPYVNLLYLNHSYFFFAPNPGANHLVRYELEFDDGRKPIVGEFPDRKTQWPRLLYHRHFMLSESLQETFAWPTFPPEPQPPADDSRRARRQFERAHDAWETDRRAWEQRRALYESLHNSIAEHLKHEYGASDVTLIRREHRFLNPLEVSQDRMQLTDKETYRNLPEVPDAETLPWNPDPNR